MRQTAMLRLFRFLSTRIIRRFRRERISAAVLIALGWLWAGMIPALSQNADYRHTQNTTDQGRRSSLEIDPSTLGLSFSLPVSGYPGRGASAPVTLIWSSKVWRVETTFGWQAPLDFKTHSQARYGQHSVSGWTTSLDVPYIEYASQPYNLSGQALCQYCEDYESPQQYIERLLIHMPNGATHELRKSDTPVSSNGQPALSGTYVSVDGARMRYEVSTQTIHLPDGSRWDLDAPGGALFIDRNGNRLTYDSANKRWTDTAGRLVDALPMNNTVSQTLTWTGAGTGGATRTWTFHWRNLSETGVMTTPEPVRYRGSVTCTPNPTGQSPYLFTSGNSINYLCGQAVTFNPVVLHKIEQPNGKAYLFTYNVFGEIDKVVLPAGGYERFEYGQIAPIDPDQASGNMPYDRANRGVIRRWVSATGNVADEKLWQYSAGHNGSVYTTTLTAPDSTRSERSIFYQGDVGLEYGFDDPRNGRPYEERAYNAGGQMLRRSLTEWTYSGPLPGGHAQAKRDPRPAKQVDILLDTGGSALAKTTTLAYDADLNQTAVSQYDYVAVSQTTGQTGAISAFPSGTLLRTEETIYLVNDPAWAATAAAYRTRNLVALPTKSLVRDGTGMALAATESRYDESAYPLTTYPVVTNWTDPLSENLTVRGNLTTVRRWQDVNYTTGARTPWSDWTSGVWIETHSWYDQCGSVVRTRDARNNDTTYSYADSFYSYPAQNSYAYPTSVTTPTPGAGGSSTPFTTTSKYDFHTGLVREVTDPNGVKTTTGYNDTLDRPTSVIQQQGATSLRQALTSYDDTNRWIATTSDKDVFGESSSGAGLKSVMFYDKLNRTTRTAAYEGTINGVADNWSVTDTVYDDLGRVAQVSNPYRVAAALSGLPAAADAAARVWATTTYDALSRPLSVTTPDTATVTTAYSGNQVLVTDQAGKQRLSQTDALGRLSSVWEITPADQWTTTVSFNGANYSAYQTSYLYDALGNLRRVDQGAQSRWFGYDSLSRLIRVKNPETAINYSLPAYTDPVTGGAGWSMAYTYDNNGNLLTKTDARGATGSYTYDALNRMTITNNWASSDGTTTINFFYDSATNGKGRLWYTYDSNKEGTANWYYNQHVITAYDALGRPTNFRQDFFTPNGSGGNTQYSYSGARTYDLAGNLKSQTYPSNRTVSYSYNSAGQMSGFTGNLGAITRGGSAVNYATGMLYNPRGQMIRETFGTFNAQTNVEQPLYQRKHYNQRGQMFDIRLGTDGSATLDSTNPADWQYANGGWNRGAIRLYYSASLNDYSGANPQQADNNGNVHRMDHFVPTAVDAGNNITNWVLGADTYAYDALNRLTGISETYQNYTASGIGQTFSYDRYGNRQIASASGAGINSKQFAIDAATNRLGVPSGQSGVLEYDAAGNQTRDTWSNNLAGQSPPDPANAGKREYDAENRMTRAHDGAQWQRYRYDASGRRVKRLVGQTGANGEVWQVYSPEGELLAEYPKQGAATVPTKEYGYRSGQMLVVFDSTETGDNQLRWLVTDHLGSTRMLVNRSGSLSGIKRRDYLPFGEELASTIGHRAASGSGYAVDDKPRQKFTGHERDGETGLDFMQARYCASVQGRFTGVDPLMASGRAGNPQSWNRYSYTLNRPLSLIDPSGLEDEDPDQQRRQQQQQRNVQVSIRRVTETYNVPGQTVAEAIANAPKQAAAAGIAQDPECEGGCTGQTSINQGYIYFRVDPVSVSTTRRGFQAVAAIADARVDAVITVTLPAWEGYATASSNEQKAWDTYVAGVKDHEEGHVIINTETIQAQVRAIQALPATFSGMGTTARAASDSAMDHGIRQVMRASGWSGYVGSVRQEYYDKMTRHGVVPRSSITY